jgi:DNA-binding transcriptional ArsR family regulator
MTRTANLDDVLASIREDRKAIGDMADSLSASPYQASALKAERLLGRLGAIWQNLECRHHVANAVAFVEASAVISSEGKGATIDRLLQYRAYRGEHSKDDESLMTANRYLDLVSRYHQTASNLDCGYLDRIGSLVSIEAYSGGDFTLQNIREIVASRKLICPIPSDDIAIATQSLIDLARGKDLPGAAAGISWLALKAARTSEILDNREINGEGYEISYEKETREALAWRRLLRLLPPTLLYEATGVWLPIPTSPVLNRSFFMLSKSSVRGTSASSAIEAGCEVYFEGLKYLQRIIDLFQVVIRQSEVLCKGTKGETLRSVIDHVLSNGHISPKSIVSAFHVTPQAAHHHLSRLKLAGIIKSGAKGRTGGHYFLRAFDDLQSIS